MFQSTRPRGARLYIRLLQYDYLVSIHAPAGGATYTHYFVLLNQSFNPRARGGRDNWLLL